MALSPVPPSLARSTSASASLDSDRHVVKVTFRMNASKFTIKPAKAPPVTETPPPTEQPPITPIAVPELETVRDATPTAPPPSAAKPPAPDEPIVEEPIVEPTPQPIALDLPATRRTDAPLPPVAEGSKPEAKIASEPTEATTQVLDPTAQAPAEEPGQPTPADKPAEQTDPPAKTPQTADATDTSPPAEAKTEPTKPTESTADESPPATPPPAVEQNEDKQPTASVYDEDSVDEPIAFDQMARPKPNAVSRRLGEKGTVRILIEVDASGNLIRHEVIDDAGHARLLKAALAALKDSTFLPAQRDDKPVHSTRIIEYRF